MTSRGSTGAFSDVQPVTMISGRYLNEGDILGRKKNVVIEEESARKLFGTENAVGKTFRTTVYGDTDMYTVVGVYKKSCERRTPGSRSIFVRRFRRYGIRVYPVYTAHVSRMTV